MAALNSVASVSDSCETSTTICSLHSDDKKIPEISGFWKLIQTTTAIEAAADCPIECVSLEINEDFHPIISFASLLFIHAL
jgi:hypothetical protein